ncbi:MAG: NAD(P)H-hydrate dehydratase [Elusimicrobia bacterium GWA2_56_46]|jgi:NAD(P)H-hydrate epimerase|nr:MAG: NAD(P)H-hydrate dehydratase [Elusimicrobia bacterium GWA2_56_46]OGR54347.1 MAG: NAD(P)H-hydrate dehydratase [Elusimicrobia bacterium GWC2_56_31]HBB65719.1 NAD(P)H-hydrate dehydratase [Elusimicrobiota bacterium]HBW22802.1 NAD(P)H-hydrate dehydratase [Elusimicrobiota bacterium]
MDLINITAKYLRPFLPERNRDSHKGDYGKVLIVAGSRGMTGAAILSARAALKAGAGLVTVACPDSEQPVLACALAEAMTLPLPSKDGAAALKAAGKILAFQREKKYDVCLLGPGLSLKGSAPEFVRTLLKKLEMPAVVDADALNALPPGGGPSFLKSGPVRIFTPHEGEALRLLRSALRFPRPVPNRRALLAALHAGLGGICLLKGGGTLITDGRKFLRNTTGGPALAKGGAGDVLAGLIAGLWAQAGRKNGFTQNTALESAALGVYLHGLCGDLAAVSLTERCVLAGELLKFLPAAFRKVKNI